MKSQILKKLKDKFSGKKVLVVGLGIAGGGAGTANFFNKLGAKVAVTDLKTKKALEDSLLKISKDTKLILGKHRLKDFLEADYIIKNPAVPWTISQLKEAKKRKIPILTDVRIFFDFAPREKIIGVTGTKGKTTACYLLRHFLKNKFRVLLTSVIGTSSLFDLFKVDRFNWIIYELSSFDLENLKKSPHIAIVTNIYSDHLDRHKSLAEYSAAKKNIVKWQNKNDYAVFPSRGKIFKKWAKETDSKILYFQEKPTNSLISETSFFAAKKAAKIIGLSEKEIDASFKTFKGECHRLEFVKKIKGISFINDSASTNPGSTIFALKKVSRYFDISLSKIILIAGGVDKNFDYRDITRKISKIKSLILLPGSASEKIIKEIKKTENKIIETNSLSEAVKKSFFAAAKGNVVLFSPGAASFNLFRNAYDRGDKFKNIIKTFYGNKRIR